MLSLSLRKQALDPQTLFCFADFVRHQSIPIQSMSADIFSFKEDIFVALAAPDSSSCVIMEWDHIEMNFRKFDNITGLTAVFSYSNSCNLTKCENVYLICKPLLKH